MSPGACLVQAKDIAELVLGQVSTQLGSVLVQHIRVGLQRHPLLVGGSHGGLERGAQEERRSAAGGGSGGLEHPVKLIGAIPAALEMAQGRPELTVLRWPSAFAFPGAFGLRSADQQ